jgi:ferric-dicitrate binding protein FerR (iron transport regulator)
MTREEYIILAGKIASGKATDQEVSLYNAWFNTYQVSYNTWQKLPEEQRQEMIAETKTGIDTYFGVNFVTRRAKLWPRITVAAAAVAAITLGTWLYMSEIASVPRNDEVVKNDIAPGKNTATLTLANGETITLSDKKTGVVIDATKLKYSDGTTISSSLRDEVKQSQLLVASTPRGGNYQFTLPDGTKVWLNADSRLEFPSQFSGQTRKIIMSGEAYFEVAKNKHMPFIVQTNDQTVTVLGTHFNVNSYGDEHGGTITSLLEGSVELTNEIETRKLNPGEQGIGTVKGIMLLKGNAADAVAWKEGNFVFNDEDLESILRKVARWYDVDIVYESKPAGVSLLGVVSRSKNVSAVLHALEQTGKVRFRIEGRRIVVMK